MIDIVFDSSKDQVAYFNKAIESAMADLKKTPEQAAKWAAVNLCKSLSASCKVSAKLRPIIKNPLFKASVDGTWTKAKAKQARNDMRRARFGVNRWKPFSGEQYFQPIYRTGEYGKYRFFEKNGLWFRTKLGRGKAEWEKVEGIPDDPANNLVPSIMTSKKRNIGRSGLAKKVWQWAQANVINGGVGTVGGVPNIASVSLSHTADSTTIAIANNLRYADAAFVGGRKDADTALYRAADSMQYKIDQSLIKATAY